MRDLIAAGNYPNAACLAEKMEISLRTVKRYLDNLRECGAPLANDRKKGGYYFTDPFWHLPPMKLSEGDLLAFFIAEQALKSAGQSVEAAQPRKDHAASEFLLLHNFIGDWFAICYD